MHILTVNTDSKKITCHDQIFYSFGVPLVNKYWLEFQNLETNEVQGKDRYHTS